MSNNLTIPNKKSNILDKTIFFGKNLTFLRNKKGLKLQEIGDELGFSRSQWNNYECNISFPKFLDLIKISKYFDVTESDLIHKDLENHKHNNENNIKMPKEFTELLNERKYTIDLQKKQITMLEQMLDNKRENEVSEETHKKAIKPHPP